MFSCRVLGERLVSNKSYLMLATTLLQEGRDFCAFLFAVASSVIQQIWHMYVPYKYLLDEYFANFVICEVERSNDSNCFIVLILNYVWGGHKAGRCHHNYYCMKGKSLRLMCPSLCCHTVLCVSHDLNFKGLYHFTSQVRSWHHDL